MGGVEESAIIDKRPKHKDGKMVGGGRVWFFRVPIFILWLPNMLPSYVNL